MDNRRVIYLDDAIDALERKKDKKAKRDIAGFYNKIIQNDIDALMQLPSVQPEIIRCKDCKYYSPMNKETKTGICNLTMHQNFGDNWFCAGAERRTE